MRYASFTKRMNAYAIDSLLVLVIAGLAAYLLGGIAHAQSPADIQALIDNGFLPKDTDVNGMLAAMGNPDGTSGGVLGLFDITPADFIVPLLTSAIYNIYFLAGSWQATPGKRCCKIRVVNRDGSRLTLLQSTLRHAASGLSTLLFGVGFLFALFTRERTTLHDMLCNTRVIKREVL